MVIAAHLHPNPTGTVLSKPEKDDILSFKPAKPDGQGY
mgnify:CR=1 FL=1